MGIIILVSLIAFGSFTFPICIPAGGSVGLVYGIK